MRTVPGLIQLEPGEECFLPDVGQDRDAPAQERLAVGADDGLGRKRPVAGFGIGVDRRGDPREIGRAADDPFGLARRFLALAGLRRREPVAAPWTSAPDRPALVRVVVTDPAVRARPRRSPRLRAANTAADIILNFVE